MSENKLIDLLDTLAKMSIQELVDIENAISYTYTKEYAEKLKQPVKLAIELKKWFILNSASKSEGYWYHLIPL